MSDLISRCELFNRLAPVQTLGEAYGIIQEMPTVDAVPVVHGRWIDLKPQGDSRFMCTVCKWKEKVPTCMGEPTIWSFCPSCGARMDGEGNGNETD